MWSQIVGKVRMALAAPVNHWWHVTFYVSTRGLTTSPIPYQAGLVELEFDLRRVGGHEREVCKRGRRHVHSRRSQVSGQAPLAELCHPLSLFQDDSGVVGLRCAGRFALDLDCRIRPHCQARAAAAARLVAHDVAPLGAIHVAMAVREWRFSLIQGCIVTCAEDMSDLVGHRIRQDRAGVVYNGKRFFGIRGDPRCKSAA
jgi:hypothetical protein